MKPIIFIFGPSGVGKSYLSNLMERQNYSFIHIDTDDAKKTFASYGYPSEWDKDFSKVDFDVFVGNLIKEAKGTGYNGLIVSFPTTHIFTQEKIIFLKQLGVIPILLWGDEKKCKLAVEKRREEKKIPLDWNRYDEKNLPTFALYSCHEYDIFRFEAFKLDGSRFSDEELKKQIADFIHKLSN